MEKKARRILIADDNRDIHEDIRYILDSAQDQSDSLMAASELKAELFGADAVSESFPGLGILYRIEDAYQGEEAVAMVEAACAANDPYSLVFMDVRMPPGMDGIEAIEKIWQIDPDVSVVIATAYSDYSWDQIVSTLGQKDSLLFMKKPFDNVSVKQITLAMTTKWDLQKQIRRHIEGLEDKVKARTDELTQTIRKLQDEIALRREKESQLAYSAHYDSLTRLLNRRSFYEALSDLSDETKPEPNFAIFYIDLDGFKGVNDIYGHDTGDQLLQEVAHRIDQALQGHAHQVPDYLRDNGKTKALFRLGGDEFTAIMTQTDETVLSDLARALIDAIKKPFAVADHTIKPSCSIGISIYQQDRLPLNTLLKHADMALYEAKKENGTFRFYDHAESQKHLEDLRLEKDLIQAIETDQIEVFYQPLINPRDEKIGIQALARWRHPKLGLVQPNRFIRIAEKSSQIQKLGEQVLARALQDLKIAHEAGYDHLFVMISCTAKEFFHPDFAATIQQALSQAKVSASKLKISMDDGFSFKPTAAALAVIEKLHEAGVQFVVNGFDNDHSTFVFLQQVPRDTIIKLDRAFVRDITFDPKNRNFLMSLIDIIQTWDLDVIINGIETKEQKQLLEEKDCILQGYHYNRPQPFPAFLKDLKGV